MPGWNETLLKIYVSLVWYSHTQQIPYPRKKGFHNLKVGTVFGILDRGWLSLLKITNYLPHMFHLLFLLYLHTRLPYNKFHSKLNNFMWKLKKNFFICVIFCTLLSLPSQASLANFTMLNTLNAVSDIEII